MFLADMKDGLVIRRPGLTAISTTYWPIAWPYRRESEGNAIVTITEGDPLSARVTADNWVVTTRKDTEVKHHSWGSLTCDATHFIVEMNLTAHERGKLIFERQWKKRIKRDLV
jgi:hypothetical protein